MSIGKRDLETLFLTFDGRLTRSRYWFAIGLVSLANLGIVAAFSYAAGLTYADYEYGSRTVVVVHLIALTLLFWPSMAVTIKRLHDRNTSGWWGALLHVFGVFVFMQAYFRKPFMVESQPDILTLLPPLVFAVLAAWLMVELLMPGTRGANRYGADPRQNQNAPVSHAGLAAAGA